MYVVRDSLPIEQLPPGTYLLSAPAMSGKRELMLTVAAEGLSQDEGALIVTTNQGVNDVISALETKLGQVPDRLRIVDCISEQQRIPHDLPTDRVEFVTSPGDLTGIGIGVSEQLSRFSDSGITNIRVGFYSLSTLLMYAELETVFRFIHVLCGRIDSIDSLGLFAIDPTTHDHGTINTLKQLFEGMIEIQDDDGRALRFIGIANAPSDWIEYPS